MDIAPGLIGFLQDDLSVSLTLIACLAIMLRSAEKRAHFLLRVLATQLVFLLFCLSINAVIGPDPIPKMLVPVIAKYTFVICIAVWGVLFCYSVPIGSAMINVASAFCVEHISQRMKALILCSWPSYTKTESILLLSILTVAFILLFYYIFEKPIDHCNDTMRKIDFLQIFVSVVVVCADIIFSFSFIYRAYSISLTALPRRLSAPTKSRSCRKARLWAFRSSSPWIRKRVRPL